MKSRKILSTVLVLVFMLTACNVSVPMEATDTQEATYTQEQIDDLQTKLDDIQLRAEAEQVELQAQIDILIAQNELLENKLSAIDENQTDSSAAETAETISSEASTSPQASTPQPAANSPAASTSSSIPSTSQTTNTSSTSSAPNTTTSSAPATSGTSKNTNATKFFATTKFVVYESSTSATNFGQSMNGTAFYNSNGKVVAEITSGTVTYAGTGYEQSAQGLLDAANDYRGTARAAYNPNATAPSGSSSGGGSTSSGGGSTTTTPSTPATSNVDTDDYASEVIRLVNQERANAGLDTLIEDSYLNEVAEERVVEYSEVQSHTRPDGTTVVALGLGENCRYGSSTPQAAVNGWMNSSGHKANILLENYVSIGSACYIGADGKLYWVITFRKS